MYTQFTFSIDRKNECIEFPNGYWLPLDDFKRQTRGKNISDGLFHLSKKNWICDSLFESIVKFCKKEFKDIDFDVTIKFIEDYRKSIKDLFKNG